MINKENCRKLFNELVLHHGGRLGDEMYIGDQDTIFEFFYTLMDEHVKKEVRRREQALLYCQRLRYDSEEKLFQLLNKDKNKKIEFIKGLEETARRPDVFTPTYLKAIMDVLFKYKDMHPEIKQTDIDRYKPVVDNTGKTFADQADLTIVVDKHYCENQVDKGMMPCADQCSTCKEVENNKQDE